MLDGRIDRWWLGSLVSWSSDPTQRIRESPPSTYFRIDHLSFEEIAKYDGFHANLKRRMKEKSSQRPIRLKNEGKNEPNRSKSEKYRDFLEESKVQ